MNNHAFVRIEFINANTGFTNSFTTIFKTTDAGGTWNPINLPSIFGDDMFVLNQDTIWLAMSESLTGGVFRTTNGGVSWTQQGAPPSSHIYMFNARIGFIGTTGSGLYRTTNSGTNWSPTAGGFFSDMYFSDSLTGWKNNGTSTAFQKTTDGGTSWVTYSLPPETGNIIFSRVKSFSNVVKDTIWGVGSTAQYPTGLRGLIYKSTNSGQIFGYQLPDTSINIGTYNYVDFNDKSHGWAYSGSPGVHTTTGGDTITNYTGVNQISRVVPKEFKLFQNYPNPFNPSTNIKYQITANVKRPSKKMAGRQT